ncbi:hypothetical protein ITI46_19340 [Streptomyces oryzae]|uniref:Conjugal transfer protein TraB n=1 Tax=Streptomyces oryzae TaxID=1434886 RepID=A0ABS3XEJ0_9ACTN|nr:hypothetical protein [Streptomyces oryzae]MBO8193798.1 hypothetical protein [Streptomyces oryzae]
MGRPGPDGKGAPPPVQGPTSKPDLERRVEALKKLKKRIDGVITQLDGSPGAKHKVDAKRLTRRALSGEGALFFEADDLFTKYNEVHDTLTSLSKSLRDQIDAMSIAVKIADGKFDQLEDEEKRRFWEIYARAAAQEEKAKHHGKGQHPGGDKGHHQDGDVPADEKHGGNTDKTGL